MKPLEGRCQTATQVKGLSPVKYDVMEADSVHLLEGSRNCFDMVRSSFLYRGLRPWYDIEWKLQELGRSGWLSDIRISADNSKRRGGGDGHPEVGLIHSRGVTGVMPCESEAHSKGSAVICRGKGKRGLYKETK